MVLFQGKVRDGFFIEAGAEDFLTHSNSLLFELKYNWTGLLVEPNPITFPRGLAMQRRAWASTACLSTQSRPQLMPWRHENR